MNKLISVSKICQLLTKDFLLSYIQAVEEQVSTTSVYVINTLTERAMMKSELEDIAMSMIELFSKRKNIRNSVCAQIRKKIHEIDKHHGEVF